MSLRLPVPLVYEIAPQRLKLRVENGPSRLTTRPPFPNMRVDEETGTPTNEKGADNASTEEPTTQD